MNLENLIVLVLVAAVCGFVAERMTQGRLPYGLVGAIFGALIGSWLLVEMFRWQIPGDMTAGGVPILTAILGAAAIIFILSVVSRSTTLPGTGRKRS
jgi:uncharacterized membrane protein YeaQ/YmgE (transglycosylase-associated protein family)